MEQPEQVLPLAERVPVLVVELVAMELVVMERQLVAALLGRVRELILGQMVMAVAKRFAHVEAEEKALRLLGAATALFRP